MFGTNQNGKSPFIFISSKSGSEDFSFFVLQKPTSSASTSNAVRLLPSLSSYLRVCMLPVKAIKSPFVKYLPTNSAVLFHATMLIKSDVARSNRLSTAIQNDTTVLPVVVCLSSGVAFSLSICVTLFIFNIFFIF